jgi:ABC-type multidrug transport system ATPase subunit/pSer/pThr/pTyr-binding forkhead associated (FHA) protein
MKPSDQGIFTFKLDDSEMTFGRDLTCSIHLVGFGISRFHASVKLNPSNPVLIDLCSTFGVRINDIPVVEKILQSGDLLSIGVYRFTVQIIDEGTTLVLSMIAGSNSLDVKETHIERNEKIGRDSSSEICLPHPLVSRHHATVQVDNDNHLRLSDNRSTNGTFVNGVSIVDKRLENGDVVQIGPYRLFVDGLKLLREEECNQLQLDAHDVSVRSNGNLILDSISVSIIPGEFVTILGPSGAGKSTLTRVLCGRATPESGSVYVNSLPLKQYCVAFSSNIGYVSQENILYKELTIAETFCEQCQLRLPKDSTIGERNLRIQEVLELLGLESVKNRRVALLSGGETKRVHLGIELLSSPALIFLDEPLAGLDPGLVRKFMQLFRRICDQGHTLVLTTHTLEQIEFCDRIIFLNRGRVLFSGSSLELCTTFKLSSVAELYEKAASIPEVTHKHRKTKVNKIAPNIPFYSGQKRKKRPSNFLAQVLLLTRRYNRILLRDRKSVLLIAMQAPLIAVLLFIVFGNGSHFLPLSFYFCVSISSIWIGGVTTIKEFARDWAFIARDYHNGLSINAYIASKLMITTEIAALESVLLGLVVLAVFSKAPLGASFFIITGAGTFAGAILGLCISAWSGNIGRAISLLPVMFIPQILFSGIMVPFDRMNLSGQFISQLTISRPVFGMLKQVCLLHRSLVSLPEWSALFCLISVCIIFMLIAVRLHCRRL